MKIGLFELAAQVVDCEVALKVEGGVENRAPLAGVAELASARNCVNVSMALALALSSFITAQS